MMTTPRYGYSQEEMDAAEMAYKAEVQKMYADGYAGDFGCSFGFALDTYGPICWAHYFKRPPKMDG